MAEDKDSDLMTRVKNFLFARKALEEAAGGPQLKPQKTPQDYRPLKKEVDRYMEQKRAKEAVVKPAPPAAVRELSRPTPKARNTYGR